MTHKYKPPAVRSQTFYATCGSCGKRSFPTRKVAKAHANRLGVTGHPYLCDERPGWQNPAWHWTSMTAEQVAAIKDRLEWQRIRRESGA